MSRFAFIQRTSRRHARRSALGLIAVVAGAALVVAPVGAVNAQPPPTLAPSEVDLPGSTTIPDNAHGPGIGPKGYRLEPLGDGLYGVTEGTYYTMFLVTRAGVVAVDAPGTMASVIPKAIHEVTNQPVKYVVYSHPHPDHIGAAADIYPSSAKRVASLATLVEMRRQHAPTRLLPDVTFRRRLRLRVGGKTLELSYKGENHTKGNIFIWAPKQRVLMLVDVITPGWVPFRYLGSDIPGFFEAYKQALVYPFRTLVGGHLTRLGTRADARESQAYMQAVLAAARQGFKDVQFSQVFQEVGPIDNQWTLFDTYLDRVVRRCTELVVPAWQDRLGGVYPFTQDHCREVVQAVRNGEFG